MSGTSYLAVAQWFTAAEQPPHLAAINPWEGVSDVYCDLVMRGGLPDTGSAGSTSLPASSASTHGQLRGINPVNRNVINSYKRKKLPNRPSKEQRKARTVAGTGLTRRRGRK